jgi:hypothetical protein
MSEERILRQDVFKAQIAVDQALQKISGQRLWKLKDPADQLRLLVLVIWSRKYHVSVEEILEILIGYYSSLTYRHAKRKPLFGAPLQTLTGKFSETLLVDKLKKKYPRKENERDWLQLQKDRQLDLLASVSSGSCGSTVLHERLVLGKSTVSEEGFVTFDGSGENERVETSKSIANEERTVAAERTGTKELSSFLKDYDRTVKQKQKGLSKAAVLGRRRFRNSPW